MERDLGNSRHLEQPTSPISARTRRSTLRPLEFRGKATIDGKRYSVAAWVKEKEGKKFFSIAFRPKEEQAKSKAPAQTDPDIPF